ncbi:MAG: LysM peptidoglycan-binding domain-containing protein [Bacteroidota bacterium]
MPRLPLAAALFLVSAPVLAQSVPSEVAVPARHAQLSEADLLPVSEAADAPLTESELTRRIARLYTRHADLLTAAADGQGDRYAILLDGLVGDLQLLAQREGVLYDARFRELYSTVLTEKEIFYGEEQIDRGDVYAVNEEAFRVIYEPHEPTLESVDLPQIPRVQVAETVIPMEVTPSVERSLRFLLRKPGHVATLRQRADTYFPMVERIMAEEGVPDELKYLAMVESALNPVARSHMAAAGMWQFIRPTGRAYGLTANRELDLRLDPEVSTRAAARHLRDLYDRFGDWQLALAGYNCNPAVIARAVRRHEQRTGEQATFWDIDHAIPRETRGYVPMFIATALILSDPDAYGFEEPEAGPQYVFDRVPVAPGTRLSEVARAIDVDQSVLRALNPALRQGRVPGTRMPHTIRVPFGYYARNAAALSRFAPDGGDLVAETVDYGRRMVNPIAPVEPAEILLVAQREAEEERQREQLAAARAARPAAAMPTPVAARQPEPAPAEPASAAPPTEAVAEPVAVAEEPREVSETPAAPPEAEPVAAAAPEPEATTPEPTPAAAPAPEPVAQATPPVRLAADSRPARPTSHRVQRGEHLSMLARRYGVSVRDLMGWNGLTNSTIRPGQRLRLTAPDGYDARAASRARAAANAPRSVMHRVSRGENLTQIARRYGVSLSDIRRWNDLSRDTIVPGQRLKIERPRRGVRG